MTPRDAFVAEFKALGLAVTEHPESFIQFPYTVPIGKFAGQSIRLSFDVKGDAPVNPPPGPHVSPPLLPPNPNADPHPRGGIHASPRGSEWQYWSRPFNDWKDGERTARRYMAHIANLFATQ